MTSYVSSTPVLHLYDEDPMVSDIDRHSDETPGRWRRLKDDVAYLLPTLPLSIASFVVIVTLLTVGVSTLVIWVGVPILVAGLAAARGFASLERVRMRRLQGRPIPAGLYDRAPADMSVPRRMFWLLGRPQNWLDVLWSMVGFVTGVFVWSVTITWLASVLGGLTYWFWQMWLPRGENNDTLAELIGLGAGRFADIALNTVFGIVALVTLPFVMRAMAVMHGGTADLLLNGRGALVEQVDAERATRRAHQVAEAESLRRFERDIHDGPQQRLVRLSMDLGRARKQMNDDPERAAATIDDALRQARETVDELRSLTRSIAPPLLVDRGLRVALDELVNRASTPTDLVWELTGDLDPAVETAVYFTVSEALTNVAKHAQAARVLVMVRDGAPGWVEVGVHDDGVGGAHESKGSGLAGLRSRLAGVGGDFHLDSPDGGPTVLSATVPRR